MKSLKTKVLSAGLFVFALCIGLHFQVLEAKADTAAGEVATVLTSTTISTKKTIKIPKKQVTTSSQKTYSRGFSGGSTIASGSTSKLVQYAFNFLGRPYVYGANGPKAFDCSGFSSYVYRQFGVSLPRTAAGQSGVGAAISKSNLRTGDLVFFNTAGYVSHVGIYIGDGQFIHASSGSKCVTVSELSSSYYTRTYVGARRILN
ncbi:C40 family peptidase [Clostridium thermarum]|uniref:C40 family peptidase n=1 Tax=Clostridium thermarum TaxID=1716543 RepID=UPI0013D2462A|nr:C40 family peptidase [Clostridium thermarum]